ncbi:hypothetical protein EGCR1_14610 (plasmid) [Enterococcus gilvus]|jgi:hypothetical protein|nr:hypothetical protein EGCR1_14610 [Enterococcus gilvus]
MFLFQKNEKGTLILVTHTIFLITLKHEEKLAKKPSNQNKLWFEGANSTVPPLFTVRKQQL